jgi:hypothetical protein
MDDLYILCTKPPACVLFQQEKSKSVAFEGLEATVAPVFPEERSISIKGFSVRRRQVPICPAFCLTDYKVQSLTLQTAVLDLKNDSSIKGQGEHKQFFSTNVQLSRPRSLHGLHLLRRIDMSDLRFRPPSHLIAEMKRLHALEQNTMAAWAGQ